jgi:hypothetical protein
MGKLFNKQSMSTEKNIHKAFASYLRLRYPHTIFTSESSGVRVSIGQALALKATRSEHTHLDVFISEPKGAYHGLYIELKRESPLKRDGSLKAENKKVRFGPIFKTINHLEEQYKTMLLLRDKGYCAFFSESLDNAIELADTYLALTPSQTIQGKYLFEKFGG